ncbi:class C sortase [Peptostreptococcus sp. D1]|uniref:class C sortase n=1 Tax=Peptostreptococcus sp. D1 TaxID=72304 RepID=UPI0008F19FF7|nr:class C sortase [Peptostreptococcus sp. D1]SFE25755.1 LPXTG-site transpeptidase (sortase) family protein [Peptostreptococcus sp. D1]
MKIKKMIGHLLIMIGICIPLQAFTQITIRDMTSSLEYKKYQRQYYKESDEKNSISKAFAKYDESVIDGSGLVDPFVVDDYKSDYQIKDWQKDQIFGYLLIPSIDVKQPIRLDATYEHLDNGVAHIYGTSLPIGGKDRRSVIAGHRGWYKGIMLLNLGKVQPGDKVFIDRNGDILTYKVNDIEIISPSQWEKLKPIKGKDMLTILSCHPIRPPSPYRMLVNCERVDDKNKKQVTTKEIENKIDKEKQRPIWSKYVFYSVTIVGWILIIYRAWMIVVEIRKK